jgi:hypothetical protein
VNLKSKSKILKQKGRKSKLATAIECHSICDPRFTIYDQFGEREIRWVVPKPKLNLHVQVGDLCLPQPLAILNDEEVHWPMRRRSPYLTALAQSS